MMRALYAGVSGLRTHQTKMDVIGNNIANVNTVAFKSSTTTFSEIMYQTTSGASGPTLTKGGINAKQIGLGVTTGSTSVNISSPGATQTTGDAFDLKITGDSFFIVNNGSQNLFTKAGAFYIDSAGNLATKANGYNVMGWQVDPATGTIRKDTVSPLHIMQEKNLTSPPEATTQGICTGVLDSNNTSVNGDTGYTMSIEFFDALGYKYNAKFAVKTLNADTKTYTVELSDILDSKNHSILADFVTNGGNVSNIFGEEHTTTTDFTVNTNDGYAYDATAGKYTYTVNGTTHELEYDNTATPPRYYYEDASTTPATQVPVALSSLFVDGAGNPMTTERAAAYDPANTLTDGTGAYRVTDVTHSYELDFNETNAGGNAGKFNYVGTPGSDTVFLNMQALGGQFERINLDFTQTMCYDNKGNCTMSMAKGATDGVTGKGCQLGELKDISVAENGEIYGSYTNGNTELLGQIAVALFANPAGLEKVGDNCYQTTLNSGEFDGIGQDITSDNGKMNNGVLEMSNVDLSMEFTEMITTQRGFQANSRIITTSDTLLEELINLKR